MWDGTKTANADEKNAFCEVYKLTTQGYEECKKGDVTVYDLDNPDIHYIIGTGSELAFALEYYNSQKYYLTAGDCYQGNCVSNLYYKGGYEKYKILSLNDTQIKELEGYGFKKELELPYSTKYTKMYEYIHQSNSGYGLNVFTIFDVKKVAVCNEENYKRFDQDWNPNEGVCCLVGEKYDEESKTCETPTSNPEDYAYRSTIDSSGCDDIFGEITVSTLDSCKNSKTGEDANLVNCTFRNPKYKIDGDQELYCYDKVEFHLNGITDNISGVLKAGAIAPITSAPYAIITRACYGTKSNVVQLYMKTSTAYSLPDIKLDLGDTLFQAVGLTLPDQIWSTGDGKTEWGETFYYGLRRVKINYGSKNTYLNKWIQIKSYLGSGGSQTVPTNEQYIDTNNNYNITIPVSLKPGTYNSKISFDTTNAIINKINTLSSAYSETYGLDSNATALCSIRQVLPYTQANYNALQSKLRSLKRYSGVSASLKESGNYYVLSGTISGIASDVQPLCTQYGGSYSSKGVDIKFSSRSQDITNDLTCNIEYEIENELTECVTDCDDDEYFKDKELLNKLVFRPILLSNPFPGISGKGRTTNSQLWNLTSISQYIDNRQNVYTKKPLYSVTLTPSVIKAIRKYNSTNSYNDFTLTCSEGRKCISSFLRRTDIGYSLINSFTSQCYDGTKFFSCAIDRGDS